jgi:hypothetical protein
MIGRVRNVRQGFLFYNHYTRADRKPTKYQTIKQIIINKVESSRSIENELRNTNVLPADRYIADHPISTLDSSGKSTYTYIDDCLTRTHVRNMQELNMSRNYYEEIFDCMLADQGISCEIISDILPEKHPFIEEFHDTRTYLKEAREDSYNATPSITPEDADKFQKNIENRSSNSSERAALEKYHFEKYLLDDYKGMTDYKMFKFFTYNKEQLINGLRELRSSIADIFMNDYHRYKNIIQSRIYFDQEALIGVFCIMVGIPNTITPGATFNTLNFGNEHYQLVRKLFMPFVWLLVF